MSSSLSDLGFLDPGDVLDTFPSALAGVEVSAWSPPKATAIVLGVSRRHLDRLETKGLPSEGSGQGKMHPWPHAFFWFSQYEIAKARSEGGSVRELALEAAVLRDRLFQLEQDSQHGHRIASEDREA